MRVGVTKYCKLQYKMLPGSADGLANLARALYQHRENPYSVNTVWGIIHRMPMAYRSDTASLPGSEAVM